MKAELKAKILAYNKTVAERKEKADDLEKILEQLHTVYAVLKPMLPDEVKAIFKKHGYGESGDSNV